MSNRDDLTPLELIVGFYVAEEIYDELALRDQLIVDLLIAGWNEGQIGVLFGIKQPSVASAIRRIRFRLANTVLLEYVDAKRWAPREVSNANN